MPITNELLVEDPASNPPITKHKQESGGLTENVKFDVRVLDHSLRDTGMPVLKPSVAIMQGDGGGSGGNEQAQRIRSFVQCST